MEKSQMKVVIGNLHFPVRPGIIYTLREVGVRKSKHRKRSFPRFNKKGVNHHNADVSGATFIRHPTVLWGFTAGRRLMKDKRVLFQIYDVFNIENNYNCGRSVPKSKIHTTVPSGRKVFVWGIQNYHKVTKV